MLTPTFETGSAKMAFDYPAKSLDIQAKLFMLGLRTQHLKMIGAFITAYGLFETTLERALWALSGKSIEGVRPFTEKMNAEQQFAMLGAGSPLLSEKANLVLTVAAQTASDLHSYRNSLVHGYLVSVGPESTPSFMKNPHWHGATGRTKPVGDAYLEEPFQDLVLIAAWDLFWLVRKVEGALNGSLTDQDIADMKADIDRARSYANEARHLRALMNHEKY